MFTEGDCSSLNHSDFGQKTARKSSEKTDTGPSGVYKKANRRWIFRSVRIGNDGTKFHEYFRISENSFNLLLKLV